MILMRLREKNDKYIVTENQRVYEKKEEKKETHALLQGDHDTKVCYMSISQEKFQEKTNQNKLEREIFIERERSSQKKVLLYGR